MRLLTFDKTVTVELQSSTSRRIFTAMPLETFVVSDEMARQFASQDRVRAAMGRVTELDPRLPNFHVAALKENHPSILFYAGSGGIGDQIMAWPVAKRLYDDYGARVTVLCDPGHGVCWKGFDWLTGVECLPMRAGRLEQWQHFAFFERVCNSDNHPGQLHPTDAMLHRMGEGRFYIADEDKRVSPVVLGDEFLEARNFVERRRIGFYQLGSSRAIRSASPEHSAFLLGGLAKRFPEITWVALADEFNRHLYLPHVERLKLPNVEIGRFPSLRVLWACISLARVVVTPDSMSMHVAGALGTPCVALFGPTDPALRISYYPSVRALHPKEACTMAPCLHTGHGFPPGCPGRNECRVLESVFLPELEQAVEEMLQKGTSPDRVSS